jgi:hypothetical protein
MYIVFYLLNPPRSYIQLIYNTYTTRKLSVHSIVLTKYNSKLGLENIINLQLACELGGNSNIMYL